jgi:hypothetical protein
MASLSGFDARNVKKLDDFDAIPAGEYLAAIVGSQMKVTKAGDGRYLELDFQILEGEYKGRHMWSRLNLEHSNPVAVQMAQMELAAVCEAVGVLTPNDSSDLHNKPLRIIVKPEQRKDTGVWTTRIKCYFSSASQPAAPALRDDELPWRNGSGVLV